MIININSIQLLYNSKKDCELRFTVPNTFNNAISDLVDSLQAKLKDKPCICCEIKEKPLKRSLTANSYFWVLVDKIAEKLKTDRVSIYKNILKSAGVFQVLPIKDSAVSSFVEHWENRGAGWYCEIDKPCAKTAGYSYVFAYFGSSSYNAVEMGRLINETVERCHELEIETIGENELKSILNGIKK